MNTQSYINTLLSTHLNHNKNNSIKPTYCISIEILVLLYWYTNTNITCICINCKYIALIHTMPSLSVLIHAYHNITIIHIAITIICVRGYQHKDKYEYNTYINVYCNHTYLTIAISMDTLLVSIH